MFLLRMFALLHPVGFLSLSSVWPHDSLSQDCHQIRKFVVDLTLFVIRCFTTLPSPQCCHTATESQIAKLKNVACRTNRLGKVSQVKSCDPILFQKIGQPGLEELFSYSSPLKRTEKIEKLSTRM